MLKLSDARYLRHDGYPLLAIKVDGRDVLLEPPRKPATHFAGLVCLGSAFDDLLPVQTIQPDGPEGKFVELKGCSDDPRLWKLVDQFGRATGDGTFQPGPVEIPD